MIKIPPHIEYVDCKCIKGTLATVTREAKSGKLECKICDREGVLRDDGEPILRSMIPGASVKYGPFKQ